MGSLDGKTVVVTAAAQGIGRASAIAFAEAGASVVATDINEPLLAELARIRGIQVRKLDVLDDVAVKQAFAEIGRVDVLFNCAGFVHSGSVLEMKDGDLDFAFDLNVKAMVRTIQA
ncbi:NAD(P)-dependent oxidoreductase, partial [Mesorhizobium loti]